ncbi:protein NDUFAF4 homolog [Nasonia vitripennis]|uniref:Uncharacterized protein n=1 Tax=Nasonia vitripennis TaxID=7425 RepID=A0A7M7T903_NASVI|nr:protein NDUFAF4 homolog [Nasonia vitripennis]
MGKTASRMTRPLKNWNIENRAHKVISKEKPTVAPTYSSTQKQIDLVNQLDPEYKDRSQKKDPGLDDNLRQVFVRTNSTEVQEIDSRSNPNRPLPKEKTLQEGFEFGFYESTVVKDGKVSLRQAMEFINNHKKNPEKYTAEAIAKEFKLDSKLTANILEFYKIFEVRETEKHHNKDVIARVSVSQRSGITVKHPIKPKRVEPKLDEVKKTRVLRQIEDK